VCHTKPLLNGNITGLLMKPSGWERKISFWQVPYNSMQALQLVMRLSLPSLQGTHRIKNCEDGSRGQEGEMTQAIR
jgi:hypothetical protein